MWYLNETNSDFVPVRDVRVGDIITVGPRPAHGVKVAEISSGRGPGCVMISNSGMRWNASLDGMVLRMRRNPDGSLVPARNR